MRHDLQFGDGINLPQDKQCELPEAGGGGASFLPPLLPLELITRIALTELGLMMVLDLLRNRLVGANVITC